MAAGVRPMTARPPVPALKAEAEASLLGFFWYHQAAPDAAAMPVAATTVYRIFDAMVNAVVPSFPGVATNPPSHVLHANNRL